MNDENRYWTTPTAPRGALPDVIENYAREAGPRLQVDGDAAAAFGLGAMSAICARGRTVRLNSWATRNLGIWILAVAPPGARKTAIIGDASAPLVELERLHAARFAAERRKIDVDLDAARRQINSLPFGDQQRDALLRRVEELVERRPPNSTWLLDDATPDSIGPLLSGLGGVAVVSGSEGTFLRNLLGRFANGAARIEAACSAFDGDSIRISRKGSEAIFVPQARLGSLLAVQPVVLADLARDRLGSGQGLLARFLILSLRQGRSSWTAEAAPTIARAAYERRALELGQQFLDPRIIETLTVDLPGIAEFVTWRNAFENKGLTEHRAKIPGIAIRLAATIELCENSEARTVSRRSIERAIALGEWFSRLTEAALLQAGSSLLDRREDTVIAAVRAAGSIDERSLLDRLKGRGAFQNAGRGDVRAAVRQAEELGAVQRRGKMLIAAPSAPMNNESSEFEALDGPS